MDRAEDLEGKGGERRVEVEFAAIVACGDEDGIEAELEVAEGKVGLRIGALHAFTGLVGIFVAALEDEPPRFREGFGAAGIVPLARPSGPEAPLVEAEALPRPASENHGAHEAVSEGQGLLPFPRRPRKADDELAAAVSFPGHTMLQLPRGMRRGWSTRESGLPGEKYSISGSTCTARGRLEPRRPKATHFASS
jgi:hypothetical protein